MKLANSPSWRRDLPAEDLARISAAAVRGRQDPRHGSNRPPKRLRGGLSPLVGARP